MSLAFFRRLLAARRCAWLLAWALCLPVAQWASAGHALLHLQAAASTSDGGKPAPLPAYCDTCVLAATIGGAAPLPQPAAVTPVVLPQAAPPVHQASRHYAAVALNYRSRAPPLPHA
jgi:hypothetical protein